MRIRQVMVVGVVWPALALAVPSLASACYVCTQFFQCVDLTPGAKLCISNAYSCSMLLPCAGGGGYRVPDAPDDGVTAWSLFDAEGEAAPVFAPESGPVSFGELARSLAGPQVRTGALADVALAFGTDFAVTLANDAGDGEEFAVAAEYSDLRPYCRRPGGGRIPATAAIRRRQHRAGVAGREADLFAGTTDRVEWRGDSRTRAEPRCPTI